MAAPVFQQAVWSNTGTGGRSPSFTLPSAPQENDVIYFGISSGTTAAVDDPSDWVNLLGVDTDIESPTHQAAFYAHRVTAAEAAVPTTSWTFTDLYGTGENFTMISVVYRGVGNDLFLDEAIVSVDIGTSTPSIPEVIPSVAEGRVGVFHFQDAAAVGATTPANWTLRADEPSGVGSEFFEYNTDTVATTAIGPVSLTTGSDEHIFAAFVIPPVSSSFSGSNVRIAAGTKARVRLASGLTTSIRLSDNKQLT